MQNPAFIYPHGCSCCVCEDLVDCISASMPIQSNNSLSSICLDLIRESKVNKILASVVVALLVSHQALAQAPSGQAGAGGGGGAGAGAAAGAAAGGLTAGAI